MLYAAAQTLARGRRAGSPNATLGIHIGCYVHVIAAAAGYIVIFHAVPVLYMAVKLAGAAYLVYLGISLFRAETSGRTATLTALDQGPVGACFVQEASRSVLNPKTAIFFWPSCPQFI